jgi:hypothetical protein
MSEWWTYGLSDFLMFSPEAYWRLVARYNAAWWPAQLAGMAAAGAVLAFAAWHRAWTARAVLLILAVAWGWVAWAFLAQRYAEIFLAANWLALAAVGQAAALLAAGLLPVQAPGTSPPWRRAGLVLVTAALLYPLLAPLTGHPWSEAEVFGWMPDPTAAATLGALLALAGVPRWTRGVLAILPVLAVLLGAATRWLLA